MELASRDRDLLLGLTYEAHAARLYAAAMWGEDVVVIPNNQYAEIDYSVCAGPQGRKDPVTGQQTARPGELIAMVEVKTRRVTSEAYPSTVVPVTKHHAARWLSTFFRVPGHCCVVFVDAVCGFDLAGVPDSVEVLERADRPGEGRPHGHYLKRRLFTVPGLREKLSAAVAEDMGIE